MSEAFTASSFSGSPFSQLAAAGAEQREAPALKLPLATIHNHFFVNQHVLLQDHLEKRRSFTACSPTFLTWPL